jgi:hypothetical protein
MDFKDDTTDVSASLASRLVWVCIRSTAVKFGIPFGPVLKHGPRSLSNVRVNGHMKPICVINVTIQWDYESPLS